MRLPLYDPYSAVERVQPNSGTLACPETNQHPISREGFNGSIGRDVSSVRLLISDWQLDPQLPQILPSKQAWLRPPVDPRSFVRHDSHETRCSYPQTDRRFAILAPAPATHSLAVPFPLALAPLSAAPFMHKRPGAPFRIRTHRLSSHFHLSSCCRALRRSLAAGSCCFVSLHYKKQSRPRCLTTHHRPLSGPPLSFLSPCCASKHHLCVVFNTHTR